MATGNPPKGSAGWLAEQDGEDTTPAKGTKAAAGQPQQHGPAPKGTEAWTEQNSGDNAPVTGSRPAPQAGVSPQDNAEAVMGYDRQMATLQEAANRYKPETEEERKKRERKEKSKKIIAAVGDGLMALGNLYFTTKGAPNMYDHKTMSQQTPLQTHLDKLKAEREANADRYLQYSLNIGDLQNERAKTLREMEAEQERLKLAREKANREQEAHGWLAALQPDKQRAQKGKADKAASEATTAEEEANNAPEMQRAKLDTEKARGEAQRASARASNASAANSYASAEEHRLNARGSYEWWDEDGNKHYAKTKDEAIMKARQHGTLDSKEEKAKNSTESDIVVRGKVTGGKKKTETEKSKKVSYPGIRKKPGGGKGGWASGLTL